MTYKTDLQTNNTNLQSILDAVNALPEAAGSGSGVETSTVTIEYIGLSSNVITFHYIDANDIYVTKESAWREIDTLEVKKNSIFLINAAGTAVSVVDGENIELIDNISSRLCAWYIH